MQISEELSPPHTPQGSARARVLGLARRLHRAAQAGPLMAAMPVLRRLQSAGVHAELSLPELFRQRATLQRKHLLRMLAVEAGHTDWERFSAVLAGLPPQAVEGLFAEEWAARLNHWFSDAAQAQAFAAQHPGSRVVAVRGQAVVLGLDV